MSDWRFHNPVRIRFGVDALADLNDALAGRSYAIVTYPDAVFARIADRVEAQLGPALTRIDCVEANPSVPMLRRACDQLAALPGKPDVLIALGGGVLCAFMALTFTSIGIDPGPFFQSWLLPCGAAGAVVIASWLVEAKQGVRESLAPMLTRLFTPLFAAMLVAFLVTLLWSGRGVAIEREMLIGFDLLLVVVLGLLVYSISARDPQAPPGVFDGVQVVLVVGALLADAVALWAMGARISEFGFSPNRVAALGENVILLVNLAGSAVLSVRFLIGRGSFQNLERWQTAYMPVYAVWAAVVVIIFPPLFRWIVA